jgi:hypothetical protein
MIKMQGGVFGAVSDSASLLSAIAIYWIINFIANLGQKLINF